MKKILLITAVLAGLFAAASCQKEEIGAVAPGTGNVTFTIQTPQDPVTRAIGDGENVDIVYYEIYKAVANHANSLDGGKPLVDGTVVMSGKVATLSLNLLEDQDYVALFWAQVTPKQQGVQYYDVTDLRNVEVKYDGVMSNDEARAAFYGKLPFNTTNDVNTEVTLVRPFAQLNIGHTLNGLDLGYDVDITRSEVTVTSPAKFFNVNTASAHTSAGPVTFALAANPDEPLKANNAVYEYAAMNYFLVEGNTGSVDVVFDIETDKGTVSDKVVAQVPVKMNFRTNLLGNLLTRETKIEIVVDEKFTQPDENIILAYDAASLYEAVKNVTAGGEVVLKNDIVLSGKSIVPTDVVFNGDGKSVVAPAAPVDNGLVCPKGNATVKNLAIKAEGQQTVDNKGLRALYILNGGNYVIDNVTTTGTTYAINVNTNDAVTLNVSNTTLEGWTSYGSSTEARFENVNFTKGAYAYFRPYGESYLKDCTFVSGFKIDFSELVKNGNKITFDNCKYAGEVITSANISALAENYDASVAVFM